jgi:haloacetate dehalogenase
LTERFGDPLAVWRTWADDVSGGALAGGHFLMEGSPRELTNLIRPFLTDALQQEREALRGNGVRRK